MPLQGHLLPNYEISWEIETCSVIVLIDTGSTHSFIDVNMARKAKLLVEEGHLAV
jgi:predicted aspartyl protease